MRDRDSLEPFAEHVHFIDKVVAAGLENGVFFYPGGNDPARDVACLGPPFIVTEEECDTIVDVLEVSIDSAVARVG